MGEVLTPKKQAVVDRLRRRIENYRRRQTDYMPRFDQTFNGFCEQNIQETLLLKQKFLENKAKRTAKKQDKKQTEPGSNIQNNLLTQQKFLKRTADDLDVASEYGDPAPKIQCGAGGGGGGGGGTTGTPTNGGGSTGGGGTTRPTESLTKFSVEIVQQLEFTTSAANSQPQQISTNVTVKALTNASVKSDIGGMNSPKTCPDASSNQNLSTLTQRTSSNCVDLGTLVECKQEPDNEFVDLEQCAAALEKDAQNNGASFPGFSEFIGDEGGDEIITSDAFKVLISEISDFNPEFMKDFDFDEQKPNINLGGNNVCDNQSGGSHNIVASITATGQMKVESDNKDNVQIHHQNLIDLGKNQASNQFSSPPYDPNALGKTRMGHYAGLEFAKAELSPAAQTLKQMAEQHQHKTQLGMNYPSNRNPRSPYGDYQFNSNNEYINSPGSTNTPPGSSQYISKNIPPTSQNFSNQNQSTNTGNGQSLPDVKQEVMFSASQTQNFQTGSSLEMQKRMQAIQQQQQQQMSNQTQSPQTPKTTNNPSMMGSYKQQYSPYGSPGGHGSPGYMPRGQGPGGPFAGPGSTPPRPPSVSAGTPTLQMSQAQQMQVNQQNTGQQIQVSAGQHLQLSGDLKSNVSVAAQQQQGMFFNQQSDTYTVSQSQTINFTQQSLRGRGPGAVPRPEQQHKLMQQQSQCVLRAQQQQMGIRPPPPEYKSSPNQMIHSLPPQRFAATALRRAGPGQQPMPPSGPMMRPQHSGGGTVFMSGNGMPRGPPCGYAHPSRQRPPNVSVGPDGLPIGNRSSAEWKHILMTQQQSVGFSHVRPFNNHQVQNNPTGVQMHPQIRGQLPPGGQLQMLPQDQLLMQGQPTNSNQVSMNLQMSQSQSLTLASSHNPHHQIHNIQSGVNPHIHQYNSNSGFTNANNGGIVNSSGSPMTSVTQTSTSSSNLNNNSCNNNNVNNNNLNNNHSNSNMNNNNNLAANDFGFEFLESLPGDPPFSAQDLLSSLDSTSNFNLNDIL